MFLTILKLVFWTSKLVADLSGEMVDAFEAKRLSALRRQGRIA